MINIRIPIPHAWYIAIEIDVVDEKTPLLIGIEIARKYSMIKKSCAGYIEGEGRGWRMPTTLKQGNVFQKWGRRAVCYTRA